MANKYEEQLKNQWERFSKSEFLPNIMLLGATGCGKSSLVNLVFGRELAPVNDVSRGTEGFETYLGKDNGMGVNLIDSRGYELENGNGDSFDSYCAAIKEKMAESLKNDPKEKIHIIWFCISVAVGVIQNYDTEILKLLLSDTELKSRVAVVLTKCDEDDENGSTAIKLRSVITKEVGRKVPVFEVSTDEDLIDELDLEKLMEWSAEQLGDEDMKEAFLATQMISLKAKRKNASIAIAGYATGAAAIGATPIPFSDAALLTPLQVNIQFDLLNGNLAINMGSILENVIAQQLKSNGLSLYYFDSAKHGEVDFVIQNGLGIDLIEVKSGNDYKRHKALDNVLSVGGWNFRNAYVLCKDNIQVDDKITYLPWYMVMFIRNQQIPKGFTFEVDISGLTM